MGNSNLNIYCIVPAVCDHRTTRIVLSLEIFDLTSQMATKREKHLYRTFEQMYIQQIYLYDGCMMSLSERIEVFYEYLQYM